MSHYLPFRPWITALFLVIAVVAPAVAWPSRGDDDAFIDRRDSIAISRLGHLSIEKTFKSLGGTKGILEHNAQLESLVSIEVISKTGASHGDSAVVEVTVFNNSSNTVNGLLFVDRRPRPLTDRIRGDIFWVESPKGWSVRPGSRSKFEIRTRASSIPSAADVGAFVVSQRIKGKDQLTGFWTSGRPSSVLYGHRIDTE